MAEKAAKEMDSIQKQADTAASLATEKEKINAMLTTRLAEADAKLTGYDDLKTSEKACYTEELVCTIPEHHHTVECLADTQADVETAEEWQAAANVALNGNWAEDLLTVAKSQLDYQQSDKNFKLDVEDQHAQTCLFP